MQKALIHIRNLGGIQTPGKLILKGAELNTWNCIENAWLRIKDGKILDFGPMSEFVAQTGEETTDLRDSCVMPAFVDSHTHLVFAATREKEFEDRLNGLTYQEIAARGGGILNSAAALREMSEDELFEKSSERLKEMILLGTGAVEIKSGYGLTSESELKMLRVIRRLKEHFPLEIKATLLAAHAFPENFRDNKEGYVQNIIEEIIPAAAQENLADYIDVFCEEGYFSPDQTARILKAGAEFGLRSKIHVNQFNSIGGIQTAISNNALSVDHLEVLTDRDMQDLAASDCIVTALPGCSFFLGIPYTPLRGMIDQNIAISIATDYNPGSTPCPSMPMMISLACIQQKLTVAEALNAATLNAAAALEISHISGSITRGKQANLIITNPMHSWAAIPYHYASNPVQRMMLKGEWYY